MRARPAAGALLLLGAAVLAVAAPAGEDSYRLKDAPGRELTQERCVVCHSLEYIPANAPVFDRGGWQKEIQKMRDRFGAAISDADAQQILEYLGANYAGKS